MRPLPVSARQFGDLADRPHFQPSILFAPVTVILTGDLFCRSRKGRKNLFRSGRRNKHYCHRNCTGVENLTGRQC